MTFDELGLSAGLMRNVRKAGYETPTPIQAESIPAIGSGRDLIATAQTGTGKTAAFLLPVLDQILARPRRSTAALVLTPTRELAQQIDAVGRELGGGTGIHGALVVGGAPMMAQQRALRAGAELVIATPGRLLDHMSRGFGDFSKLGTLILDEADQMFDMGFLPDLKRIVSRLPADRQTLLFSATMPPAIANLADDILRNPQRVAIGEQGRTTDTVSQTAYPVVARQKPALLMHLLRQWERPSVLVFTRTKHGARKLAKTVEESGHRVAELHGDRTPAQRLRAMQVFRTQSAPVMVATNIAARGIDVRHVTHVVNFDVPHVPEEYVHRIGRTGRGGDTGSSFIFVTPEEMSLLSRIERQLGKRIQREQAVDFDYEPLPMQERPKRSFGPARGRPVGVGVGGGPRKPYRGQGRGRR